MSRLFLLKSVIIIHLQLSSSSLIFTMQDGLKMGRFRVLNRLLIETRESGTCPMLIANDVVWYVGASRVKCHGIMYDHVI